MNAALQLLPWLRTLRCLIHVPTFTIHMKKRLAFSITVATLLCLSITVRSQTKPQEPNDPEGPLGTPTVLPMNINRLLAWYNSNGNQEYPSPLFSGGGMTYPRGTALGVYASGILWGGRLHDGAITRLHVNGQYFSSGMRQGAILGIRTSSIQSPNDSSVRLYKIRRDFRRADLRQDAADTYRKNITDVTNADLSKLRAAYAKDWAEWPWQFGAPFYDTGYLDRNGQVVGAHNGVLDWGEDINRNAYLDPGEDVNRNGRLDGETPGYADADMVLWYVCNDIVASRPFSSQPVGMELQGTIWAYNRTDALANVIYKRFRLLYKGTASTSAAARIDSMFIAQVSDPDLGDATDDYAGCDSVLSLGFVYNSSASDRLFTTFNLPPPAVGFDLIQGPVVRGAAGEDRNRNGIDDAADYAIVNLKLVGPGFINLPMTSFVYFDRHTRYGSRYQAPFGGNVGAIGWYQVLRGLPPSPIGPPDPSPLINPTTQSPSKFWANGDPVLRYGWLDGEPLLPGEREVVIASGPFSMAVGDTQEVVFAVIGGLGSDYLSSIKVLKYNDKVAQVAYNSTFSLPKSPPPPKVKVVALDKQILLEWGHDAAAIAQTESTVQFGNYRFEGYNVYQLPDGATDLSNARKLATFDLVNNIRTISQEEFDVQAGEIYLRPVQYGTDSGIRRSLLITEDKIRNRPLVNGQSYFFAVTAYSYTPDQNTTVRSVESPPEILTAVPEWRRPGTVMPYSVGDTIAVRRLVGNSDAVVVPVIYNPRDPTGAAYHIRFDTTTSRRTFKWSVTNASTGRVLLSDIADLSGRTPYRVAEAGLELTVSVPPVGLRQVIDQNGNNVFGTTNPNPNYTVLSQRGTLRAMNGIGLVQRDYELRFDGQGSYAIRLIILNSQSGAVRVPFSVWDVGRGPGDTPVQVIASFRDSGDATRWNVTPTGVFYGDTLFRIFEPIHITNIPYPTGGNDSLGVFERRTDVFRGSQSPDDQANALWGILIADKDNDGLPPPVGTVIKFVKYHEIQHGDVVEVQPLAPTFDVRQARADVAAINVVPNPYYGDAVAPTGVVRHRVMFTHLPARAYIRIFNLGGIHVRTLLKDDPNSQFVNWDLKNEYDLPVGSGIYIAHIELPDIGATRVLKLVIIQGQERVEGF
jgi:hypothetical protein